MDFIDEACTVEIRREIVVVAWSDGLKLAFPMDVFRIQLARANKVLAEYDARKADVVPIRGRKKRGGDQAASP